MIAVPLFIVIIQWAAQSDPINLLCLNSTRPSFFRSQTVTGVIVASPVTIWPREYKTGHTSVVSLASRASIHTLVTGLRAKPANFTPRLCYPFGNTSTKRLSGSAYPWLTPSSYRIP
ncbi:hypothetical protein BJV78DRAFT_1253484 [Lactifluus subvellereus]|nr:hypothetical protein BJV78DRAFT_1253484 [Lactifluus subvellereus]